MFYSKYKVTEQASRALFVLFVFELNNLELVNENKT